MNWSELLNDIILQVVRLALIYMIGYICNYVAVKIKNDKVKEAFEMMEAAAKKAVTVTSQTFVDTARKNGAWDRTTADEAFALAIESAKACLSEDAYDIVQKVTKDAEKYLRVLIEEQVREQKKEPPMIAIIDDEPPAIPLIEKEE